MLSIKVIPIKEVKKLNTRLRSARIKKGLTQVAVAKKAGITARSYQQQEYGERTANVKTALRIARALDATVEDLFDVDAGQAPSSC